MAYHFDTVKLEKGMYNQTGRTFTQVLEEQDPSEQYKGTSLEGMDAFQRQLKRFDIKVKGAGSDVVEKFFRTSDSAVLFPEYIARSVRQGMEEYDILPNITAAVTRFDGMDYRSITSVPDEEKELRRVEEGAAIPSTTVTVQENLVKLHKRGRMLVASYEAIRYQKLDLFSVTLRQIGAHINRMHLEDAIQVLEDGDGNNNPAETISVKTGGTLTYDDLVKFWNEFDPYEMNTMLVSRDVMLQLLKLDVFFGDELCVFQFPMEEKGFDLATKSFTNAAHKHNLAVHYWTINDPEDMRLLIEIGADGIMTDYPHRLKAVYDSFNG